MPDQLNLSLWLRDFNEANMLERFEQLLRVFPFTRLRSGVSEVKIYAVEFSEPPLVEQAYPDDVTAEAVMALCHDFENPDCAYEVEGWWDLWRYQTDWQLMPVRALLTCLGPQFENEVGDHLRLQLGAESDFLPAAGAPLSLRKARSNLAGLVRLARDLAEALPVEGRSLWSESGENFAERLDGALFDEAT
jgi:hypothetical protein